MDTVQRPGLGQIATLGMLYDGHNDSFLPTSIIPESLPDSVKVVKITAKPSSTSTYSASDTYKEKFTKLGFYKGLQASFLGGLINAEGSSSYVAECRNSDLTTEASLYHKVVTVSEKLELAAPCLREHLDFSVLQDSPATHLVTEIIWGASTVITARHSRLEDVPHAAEASAEALKVELLALKAAVEGSNTISELRRNTAQRPGSFQVKVFSDVKADDGRSPTTFEEAFDFLSNVPKYVKQSNRGKGKQLTYRLVPLTILSDIFSHETFPEISLYSPGTETLEYFVGFFEELRTVQRALSAYRLRTKLHRHCIPEKFIQDVQDLKSQFNTREAIVRSEFGATVQEIRDGESTEALQKLLAKFQTGPLSPKEVRETISQYSAKMDFADKVIGKGATYIGFVNPDIRIEGETCTFRFNWNTQSRELSFKENEKFLIELLDGLGASERAKIVVRDCDGISDSKGSPETVGKPIISREKGKYIVTVDMLEESKELSGKGLMESEAATFEVILGKEQKRPPKVAKVNIPCPGHNCTSNETPDWICSKCRSTVIFGFADLYLYCDCGRAKYQTWSFRCTAVTHGSTFVKYDDGKLCEMLSKLPHMDALNILILGATGVGKSTFINAFVNYLEFDSLDDAIRRKSLSWLIPFAFSSLTHDSDGKLIETIIEAEIPSAKIVPSSAKNEKFGVSGQSATQKTMVHSVQMGNTLVRLFDTPGIGDTRGMDVDKSNMADILATLTNYDELHGIIILLKPNHARMTAPFTFCLGELLTHLHRDATRNLVFGFTSARGSNYHPGDTVGPLKQCLKMFSESQGSSLDLAHDNVYCFDSECFRYLAAYHRGADMGSRDDYVKSWETSAKESQRLLRYFKTRQPHMIKETTDLNDARHMLTTLMGQMSEIMGNTAETATVVEKQRKHLDSGKIMQLDLQAKLDYNLDEYGTIRALLTEVTSELEARAFFVAEHEKKVTILKEEHDKIEKAAVHFCLFLKRNSITPYNHGVINYLSWLIMSEKANVGPTSKIDVLEAYKAKYVALEAVMSKSVDDGGASAILTKEELHAKVGELYKLQMYGRSLHNLTTTMTEAHKATYHEYNHQVNIKSSRWSVISAGNRSDGSI